MRPVLSIAIPTYNRCDFLEYSLNRHHSGFNNFNFSYEIVISDNCSSDSTSLMVQEKSKENPNIKYFRKNITTDAVSNYKNAIWKSKGELVIYLADDDSLIPEVVAQYVEAMIKDRDIAGIYTDWIAYDDNKEIEMHRYFKSVNSVRINMNDKEELIHFVFENQILPEVGIWRRDYIVDSIGTTSLQYPFLNWMYNLSDLGSLVFSNVPFYRENRILKPHLTRGKHWANIDSALSLIGDEMRIALENLIQLLKVDSGTNCLDTELMNEYRKKIDDWLYSRVNLEISRAIQRKNWILAVELKRRLTLWYGVGSGNDFMNDLRNLSLPATFQHIHNIYENDPQVSSICFTGFSNANILDIFKNIYPEIEVIRNTMHDDFKDNILYIYPSLTQNDLTNGRFNLLDFSRHLDLYRISSRLVNFQL